MFVDLLLCSSKKGSGQKDLLGVFAPSAVIIARALGTAWPHSKMRMAIYDSDDSGDDSDYNISDGALEALSSDSGSSSADEDTVVRRNGASTTRYKLVFLEASLGLQIRQNLTQGGVYVVSTDGNRGDRDDAARSKIIVGDLMVKVGRTPVGPTATVDTCVSILQRNSQRPITITFQRGQSSFSSASKNAKDGVKKTSETQSYFEAKS